jgi:hypothetical protein
MPAEAGIRKPARRGIPWTPAHAGVVAPWTKRPQA